MNKKMILTGEVGILDYQWYLNLFNFKMQVFIPLLNKIQQALSTTTGI